MHRLSGLELSAKFRSGEYTAVQITRYFLDRIQRMNSKIGAFITICEERAMQKAAEQDALRASGATLGRLAGVPIAIKDNIHVEGVVTTCASKFLTNYKAPFASTAVRLLEAEGAIIVGKTNLDEFAMGSTCGNSALQKTWNPWDLERVPGGSSGGSAAAVAARMVPIALGSDTGGSVRQPASLTGVVGLKPTYGRVSRFGLVAYGSSLDCIGPLAHSVEDVGAVMEIIGTHCDRDSTSYVAPAVAYLAHPIKDLSGVTLGIPAAFLQGFTGPSRERFDEGLAVLKKLGAKTVDIDLQILKYSVAVYYVLATAEASTNLARFDGIRYGQRSKAAHSLEEVYDMSKEEGFGAEVKRRILLGTFVLSAGYQDAYYRKAQKVRAKIIQSYAKAFETCDLILMPTSPETAWKPGAKDDPLTLYLKDIYTISQNLAGLPAISMPGGLASNGLPVGLQLIGPQKADKRVWEVAQAFDKATNYTALAPEHVTEAL